MKRLAIVICSTFSLSAFGQADLDIVITSPAGAEESKPLVYTITVTNKGPEQAEGVTLTYDPAASAPTMTAISDQGACSGVPGKIQVLCDLGSLPSGSKAAATIEAGPTSNGVIKSAARVVADSPTDPVAENNDAEVTTTVTEGVAPHVDIIQ